MRGDPAGARERTRPRGRAALGAREPRPLHARLSLGPRRQGHVDSAADAPRAAALMSPRARISEVILAELEQIGVVRAPLLLMSYLNPLLAFGLERLGERAARAGVAGFIVPDLPLDESSELRAALDAQQLALVQMVTPVTEPQRLAQLCAGSQGFVYAVTMTGTTGGQVALPEELIGYLERVRASSPLPVCAGFGIRSREQVERLRGHVDGVVIGSALVEVLERGDNPTEWLGALRGG